MKLKHIPGVRPAMETPTRIFRYGDHMILADGREIKLTQMESEILSLLARHKNRAVSYETIASQMWPIDADRPSSEKNGKSDEKSAIQVHASHLNKKLQGTGLKVDVVWGLGYRLVGDLEVDGTIR